MASVPVLAFTFENLLQLRKVRDANQTTPIAEDSFD